MRQFLIILTLVFSISAFAYLPEDGTQAGENYWGSHGAIAYSPTTGIYGRSYNWNSRWQAEQVAMSYCRQFDCRVVVWFNNACGALAVSTYYSHQYGWGWSYTQAGATSQALTHCYGPCYIKTSACSY